MVLINPEATPVQGNTKVAFVLSVAVLTAPDLSSEIGAGTTLDVSMFVRDWNPQLTANTGNAPNRLGTTNSLPIEGNTNFSPIELRAIYDPQGDNTVDENKLKVMLTRGLEFYAVVRKGIDAQVTFAIGDKVEVWKCRAGKQNRGRSGDDEFSEYEFVQNIFPLADFTDGVVVA